MSSELSCITYFDNSVFIEYNVIWCKSFFFLSFSFCGIEFWIVRWIVCIFIFEILILLVIRCYFYIRYWNIEYNTICCKSWKKSNIVFFFQFIRTINCFSQNQRSNHVSISIQKNLKIGQTIIIIAAAEKQYSLLPFVK